MKDILGNELSVGDTVVFGKAQKMSLHKGTIKKLNPKTVLIEHDPYQNGWEEFTQSQRSYSDVVKVEGKYDE